WQRNLGSQLAACGDMPDRVFGITDTPFVDRTTQSLFVVGGDGNPYALDLATGTTRAGWPATLTSDPAHEHVWSAITFAGGALYVETASYCDLTPYYGRAVKIDLPTPSVVATWSVSPSPGRSWWRTSWVSSSCISATRSRVDPRSGSRSATAS